MRVMSIDDVLEGSADVLAPDPSPDPRRYDWNRLVTEGRAARRSADGGRWRIGQLASLVERRYRSGALKRFADEIGESLGSVRRFRWVVESYDPTARLRFGDLSFSHFQAVAALPDRLLWLQRAQRGSWSVDRLITESRKRGDAAQAALLRPFESMTRRLAALAESDQRALQKAAKAGLKDALDELAEQVEALRARLDGTQKRALKRVR